MTCANCEVLRAKLRDLERELGLRLHTNGVSHIASSFGMQPASARAVLVLYQAKGRWVSSAALGETLDLGDESLRASLSRARKHLPIGAIESRWGLGYRLSDESRERVAEVLG